MAQDHQSVSTLAQAARDCTACELYKNATQVVFSEGNARAHVMLIGETPGNDEDLAGRPFVGPAGKLLRRLLEQAGFGEKELYFTNAVKHFKWQPRGTRRLHVTPSYREVTACRPWLLRELEIVKPRIVVCLGATAAQTLLGREFRVTQHRGEVISMVGYLLLPTLHPAAVLRMPTPAARQQAESDLLADLARARELDVSHETATPGYAMA
jgi:uracil-DNA glycosylase family protein